MADNSQILYNRPTFPAQLDMSHPLTRGLVGCWILNEEGGMRAFDSSPYGNHGTLTGFTNPVRRPFNGLLLDGVNDGISFTTPGRLNNPLSVAISVWVKKTDAVGTERLIDFDAYGIEFEAGDVSLFRAGGAGATYTSYPTGTWMMLTGVFGTGHGNDFYVNGSLIATEAGNGTGATLATSTIGYWNAGAARYVNGTIGSVTVWTRTLTAQEIKNHYLNPYEMFLK
mgnify:CR=1 FL=1